MTPTQVSLAVLVVTITGALAVVPTIVFLTFAGLLLAILLDMGASPIRSVTSLPRRVCVLVFALLLTSLLVLFATWFAPSVAAQFDQLVQAIPAAFSRVQGWLEQYEWAQNLLSEVSPEDILTGQIGSTATSALSTTFGGIGNLVIILFVGLYGALEPGVYRKGLLILFPKESRGRGGDVTDKAMIRLRQWLKAQLMSMTAVGVLTALGLWAIGLPLPILLGGIAALLAFIPNIGPILAALPALALAMGEGVSMMLWVVGVYVAVQTLESYFITPLIQRQEASLPPALIISMQVLFGLLFGILGLALATPFTALLLVLIRELYVRDYVNQRQPG
ncbi:AI-2E family transporter [Peteryoungia desertarenae]|uniref:AI-2E family transporter n=1 Tax=Peteryoungia desertarenae TaxID=1813451 RepID=A0ABX6QIQ9_9HYPH|nr:AI-2E family transporter [Peteryoungia desertarenae]QLF68451.1 AI-2E family transporter [Peteryoungia desertarenae]